MNQDERIIAEKALQQFGNSIEIKDYGLALAIMHRQIQYAETRVKNVSSNSMSVCGTHLELSVLPLNDKYKHCGKCGYYSPQTVL